VLRLGLSPGAKVLDLKARVRCRGWGARGRAVVSVKRGREGGSAGNPSLLGRRCLRGPADHHVEDQVAPTVFYCGNDNHKIAILILYPCDHRHPERVRDCHS
jgi:hypothetical protein